MWELGNLRNLWILLRVGSVLPKKPLNNCHFEHSKKSILLIPQDSSRRSEWQRWLLGDSLRKGNQDTYQFHSKKCRVFDKLLPAKWSFTQNCLHPREMNRMIIWGLFWRRLRQYFFQRACTQHTAWLLELIYSDPPYWESNVVYIMLGVLKARN